jgi:hypothetical protein
MSKGRKCTANLWQTDVGGPGLSLRLRYGGKNGHARLISTSGPAHDLHHFGVNYVFGQVEGL